MKIQKAKATSEKIDVTTLANDYLKYQCCKSECLIENCMIPRRLLVTVFLWTVEWIKKLAMNYPTHPTIYPKEMRAALYELFLHRRFDMLCKT